MHITGNEAPVIQKAPPIPPKPPRDALDGLLTVFMAQAATPHRGKVVDLVRLIDSAPTGRQLLDELRTLGQMGLHPIVDVRGQASKPLDEMSGTSRMWWLDADVLEQGAQEIGVPPERRHAPAAFWDLVSTRNALAQLGHSASGALDPVELQARLRAELDSAAGAGPQPPIGGDAAMPPPRMPDSRPGTPVGFATGQDADVARPLLGEGSSHKPASHSPGPMVPMGPTPGPTVLPFTPDIPLVTVTQPGAPGATSTPSTPTHPYEPTVLSFDKKGPVVLHMGRLSRWLHSGIRFLRGLVRRDGRDASTKQGESAADAAAVTRMSRSPSNASVSATGSVTPDAPIPASGSPVSADRFRPGHRRTESNGDALRRNTMK
jgi:hypothetical protein